MSGWTPESYTIGYRPVPQTGRIRTSRTEILHASLAFVVLSFDLAVIWAESSRLGTGNIFDTGAILAALPVGALAALSGFLIHEGAHKVAAERHGFWAEFRMAPIGLVLSVLVVVTIGFIFAAPGATMVRGMGDRREWGRTSLAGPLVNCVAGGAFGLGALAGPLLGARGWIAPLLFLTYINFWWATFNLIPFGPLDGAKVWRWDRRIWAVSIVIAGALAALAFVRLTFFPSP